MKNEKIFCQHLKKYECYDFPPEQSFFVNVYTANSLKTGTGTKTATSTSPWTDFFYHDMAEITFSVCNL